MKITVGPRNEHEANYGTAPNCAAAHTIRAKRPALWGNSPRAFQIELGILNSNLYANLNHICLPPCVLLFAHKESAKCEKPKLYRTVETTSWWVAACMRCSAISGIRVV